MLFESERANLILVDRFKRDLFRYEYDEPNKQDVLKSFHIEKGLAGYVTLSGHTLFVQNIDEDTRYYAEVDDPKGVYCKNYHNL